MAEQQKNTNINEVWASGGDTGADVGTGKRLLGFVPEKPTSQIMNQVLNLLNEYAKHNNEQGISDWDAVTNYAIGGLAKGSDDRIYRSLSADNVGVDPVGENSSWEIAFVDARNHQGNMSIGGGLSNWNSGMDVIQVNDAGSIVVDDSGAMYLLVNAYLDYLSLWRSFWTNPTPMMVRLKDGSVDVFVSPTSGVNVGIAWQNVMSLSQSELTVNGRNLLSDAVMVEAGGFLQADQTDVKSVDLAGDGMSAIYLSYGTLYELQFGFRNTVASTISESTVGTFDLTPLPNKARWGTNGNSILSLNNQVDSIFIHPVSTPWDSTTADLSNISSSSFTLPNLNHKGFAQTRDGNVIYTVSEATTGLVTFTIDAYTLQSPYDYQNVMVTSTYTKPPLEYPISGVYDVSVSSDGLKLYVLALAQASVSRSLCIMTLAVKSPGDMSSVTIEGESFIDVSVGGVIYPYGTSVSESGNNLIVVGRSTYGLKDFSILRGAGGM